jgi:hypothetical protein
MTENADEKVWVSFCHLLPCVPASERATGIDGCVANDGTDARHGIDECDGNGAIHEIVYCHLHRRPAETYSHSAETMRSIVKMSASGLALLQQIVRVLGWRHDDKGRTGGCDVRETSGCQQHLADLHVSTQLHRRHSWGRR